MDQNPEAVLTVNELCVEYRQDGEWTNAVKNVSFQILSDQTVGLVGESGSGKTTVALAVLRYLPDEGRVCSGEVNFLGTDLLSLPRSEMRELWGNRMSFVPQDARSSLNPSLTIGSQVRELLQRSLNLSGAQADERTRELFHQVQLGDPDRVRAAYPHQISGGMLQRVLTAMAISTEPDLLILDEPTSSLDVTTQAEILDLYRRLLAENPSTGVLYITHNLGVTAQLCSRLAVMYAGELVEAADTREIYQHATHPYTTALVESVPRLGENKSRVKLRPIQGRIPPLGERPGGCVFRPRCPLAVDVCEEYPPLYEAGPRHVSRCHRWEGIQEGELDPRQPPPEEDRISRAPADLEEPENILAVDGVQVFFQGKRSLKDLVLRQTADRVRAVDGVDLAIPEGRVLGLVGESGSGKTTLARAVLGLDPPTAGTLNFQGRKLEKNLDARTREILGQLQIVFQDPEDTLNPYRSVRQILSRPVRRFEDLTPEEVEDRVGELLQAVHLSPALASRLPDQLSGGEKQRVAIARALATAPELVIADEPISSLDVSVQASILNLFNELQIGEQISLMFISHDLAVVGYLADEIAVMYLGQLMERGPVDQAFDPPFHPYMEALLSSVPLVDPEAEQIQIRLEGEIPSASKEISGCPFHTRCHRYLGAVCKEQVPPWRKVPEGGKWYFCHIEIEDLKEVQERAFTFKDQPEENV